MDSSVVVVVEDEEEAEEKEEDDEDEWWCRMTSESRAEGNRKEYLINDLCM